MSLINDALKRARQSQSNPPPPPGRLPPRPVEPANHSSLSWLLPAIIIFLIVVACFFIGLSMAHRTVMNIVNAPEPGISVTQPVEVIAPAPAPPPVAPVVSNEPPTFKVQGIGYDPSNPWAIVNGRTVYLGDRISGFHVKAISKYTVTLAGADGKEKTVHLGE